MYLASLLGGVDIHEYTERAARQSRDRPTLVVRGRLHLLGIARSTRRRRRRADAASRLARRGPRESCTTVVTTSSLAGRRAVTPLQPRRAGVPELIHPTDPTGSWRTCTTRTGYTGAQNPRWLPTWLPYGTGRSTTEPGSPSHHRPRVRFGRPDARDGEPGGGR